MPDIEENKRSRVEKTVYGFAYTLGFLLLLASFFMVLLSPYMGGGFLSYIFMLSPILAVIVLVGVWFSSKKRSNNIANGNLLSEKKVSNYNLRLLIMFGVVILGCITLFGISLLFDIKDNASFIVALAFTGLGGFGVFKLVQLLRK